MKLLNSPLVDENYNNTPIEETYKDLQKLIGMCYTYQTKTCLTAPPPTWPVYGQVLTVLPPCGGRSAQYASDYFHLVCREISKENNHMIYVDISQTNTFEKKNFSYVKKISLKEYKKQVALIEREIFERLKVYPNNCRQGHSQAFDHLLNYDTSKHFKEYQLYQIQQAGERIQQLSQTIEYKIDWSKK